MTETTITPARTAVVITDDMLRTASESAAATSYQPVWTGLSGEESSGESVAHHLEATLALLDKKGWIRAYDYSPDPGTNLAVDDSMTVKAMLRSLFRFIREETSREPQLTVSAALRQVGETGEHGDSDTARVAGTVLDLVVQAYTGSGTARATSWSERQHRTYADITALLTAGAHFARLYGPGIQVAP